MKLTSIAGLFKQYKVQYKCIHHNEKIISTKKKEEKACETAICHNILVKIIETQCVQCNI